MAIEQINPTDWQFTPGPIDVHTHPRIFDAITKDNFVTLNNGQEGKAGLRIYTQVALRSGITAMIIMPNEALRLLDESSPERTTVEQWPIATLDRVKAVQAAISHEAYTPSAIHFGIDPQEVFSDEAKTTLDEDKISRLFASVADRCTSVKLYLAPTTGGNNVDVRYGARLAKLWNEQNPGKPVVVHVEGSDAMQFLIDTAHQDNGKEIPIHIAHVSSRLEMEAVQHAKRAGMDVTCEVTPHHLFLNESARQLIGGWGCMKPSLKPEEDRLYLWQSMADIDVFASDCAPHRPSDKVGDNPAFGVTNHTLMLPLLLGAVREGLLSWEGVYRKFCITPRQRFNLPLNDNSFTQVTTRVPLRFDYGRLLDSPPYGATPFTRLPQSFKLGGMVIEAQAGRSHYHRRGCLTNFQPSYTHLIQPRQNAGVSDG